MGGITTVSEETVTVEESKCVVLGLSTTQVLLKSEAEHLQIAKIQRNGTGKGILDTFSSDICNLFIHKDKDGDD
eukprot:10216973-Ditylum_brightwellii.AAC.1